MVSFICSYITPCSADNIAAGPSATFTYFKTVKITDNTCSTVDEGIHAFFVLCEPSQLHPNIDLQRKNKSLLLNKNTIKVMKSHKLLLIDQLNMLKSMQMKQKKHLASGVIFLWRILKC